MATKDYIPGSDAILENWADQFAKKVAVDFATLGVPEALSNSLSTGATDFTSKMALQLEAKIAAKAATEAKVDSKALLITFIRTVAGIIQNNPAVTDEEKKALGLPVHDTVHSVIHAYPPVNLNATGKPTGVNHLDWEPGENIHGCMYIVEGMKAGETKFSYVDVVTKTKYNHKSQKPGEQITYQVKAKRGEEVSQPSNNAVVYPAGAVE
jgi:hypothetical protein